MLEYFLKRIPMTIVTLFLVAVAVFTLVRLMPGDPIQIMVGDSGTDAQIAELRRSYGLDQSIAAQFFHWLSFVIKGDFGLSISTNQPVFSLIWDRFQVSAIVVLIAVLLATLIAVPLGLLAAWKQNSVFDLAVVTVATICLSIPSFWLSLLLLILFGLKLEWLPVIDFVPFSENAIQASRFLVLPILTLVIIEIGALCRMSRASTIEVLRLEYIMHARAKGTPEWRVLLQHALPNAFAPTWTLIGLTLGNLLGGIAVIETVFTLPGLGRLLVDSIYARDYPVIQGCLLFTATIYVAVNFCVDLCYPLFDPRIKYK